MRTLLFASLVAAATLFATTAHAADVVYPDQEKIFATGILVEDIVTPDAIYPGPHGAVVKDYRPDPVLSAALATAEEFLFQVADPVEVKAAPHCHAPRDGMVATADCDCTHC
jgi:hypothetical protein